jgi:hypothetical protein
MVPTTFENFFTAMAEGGATLLGLIFVASSIRRASGDASDESGGESTLGDAALLALANGFIVSASAIVPEVNVAYVALPMGVLGVGSVLHVALHFLREAKFERASKRWSFEVRTLSGTVAALGASLGQIDAARRLLLRPRDELAFRQLAIMVLAFYAIGLVRSWMLVGGARHGLRAVFTRQRPPLAR